MMADLSGPSDPSFGVDALTGLSRVVTAEVAPCGTWCAVQVDRLDRDDARYVSDLWRVSATDPDVAPIQLTWGDSHDHHPRFRADGALLFLSNRAVPGDDERRSQVWMMPAVGGEPRPLTDEPTGVSAFECGGGRLTVLTSVWPGIAHAEQRAHGDDRRKHGSSALRYDTMPVRSWDHWLPMAAPHLVTIEGATRRDLTPDADRQHRDTSWAMSADGRWAAIGCEREATDRLPQTTLRLFDLDTHTHRDIALPPRALLEGLAIAPGGRWAVGEVHTRADSALGRPMLMRFDLDTGEATPLAADWDVHPKICQVTDAGHALVTAGLAGRVRAFRVELKTGAVQALSDPGFSGCIRGLRSTPDGATIGLLSQLRHPPEVCRLADADAAPIRLAPLSGFDPNRAAGVTLDEFTVESSDGIPVHSLVLRPAAKGPTPTLLWVHGGPVGQHEDGWHWRWNALLAALAGYTVVLPNPRGSTGYGQPFIEGIWNNSWGSQCLDDVLAVADHMDADPGIDSDRIAVMGASFGGYMTNWLAVQTGDRFRCMVTHAGVYRMSTFHSTSDWPAWFRLQAGCEPANPDFDRHSPHRLVHQWTAPTLVTHGERDFRVPMSQALMLFEDLQRHGVPSSLLAFPDENHWLLKPRNIRVWYTAWMDFVAAHLVDDPPA